MRIPKTHKRIVGDEPWSLVNYLSGHEKVKRNKPKTIKWYFSNENSIYFYNNRKAFQSNDFLNDPLAFGDSQNGGKGRGIPDEYAGKPFWVWEDLAMKPFFDMLAKDPDQAFSILKKYDDHSMRSFFQTFDSNDLLQSMGLPPNNETLGRNYPAIVVDWIETLEVGTGYFDRAFTDTIIDSWQFASSDWVTIDGGISRLVDAIVEVVDAKRIRVDSKVVRISRVAASAQLQITTARKQVFRYDHVISTATLGLLQQMDTRDLGFDLKKRMATRTLTYEASVKIGLKFRTRWWENAGKMGGKPIRGGQTWTDLPFRKVVYPSHGVDCKDMSGITRLYILFLFTITIG